MSRIAGYLAAGFLTVLIVSHLTGGLAAAQSGQPMILPVDPVQLVVQTGQGKRELSVEVADDPPEHSSGLMFRRDLPEKRGMLFVLQTTRRAAFWMKNTPLPLDLIFVGENGRITAIRQGVPFSEAPIAPIDPVRFVLEVHEGTADRLGIAVGDRLRHPEIDAIAGAD